MKRNKAFTLIELVSVLVILAILGLIVTLLVLNIIRKARIAADKRSIDAYGRSIELAVADYLLENGTFPTSIEELTIEYSGDRVVCETTQLNTDSSVYIAGCTVGDKNIDYTYGMKEILPIVYSIGDEVTYNGVQYYVIENSSLENLTVKLLKVEPLTFQEVENYLEGTSTNISNNNGYGEVEYGTTNNYTTSYVKIVVDTWANENVSNGLEEARLITKEELESNFEFEEIIVDCGGCGQIIKANALTTSWLYNKDYEYWTQTPIDNSIYTIRGNGTIERTIIASYIKGVIRPVIVLSKSALN